MTTKIISLTRGALDLRDLGPEDLVAYTARVSNPANQMNTESAPKLIAYLIKNKHWSPFEMVSVCMEIKTSRAIAAQILRHRSFAFQEFSQRYAEAVTIVEHEARRQDVKNRQNSIDDLPESTKKWFRTVQAINNNRAMDDYKEALKLGIAKEQARFLLPLSTETTIYMTGTLRSWIHYLDLRSEKGTQLEHREIAESIKSQFVHLFPATSQAMGWSKPEVQE